MVNKKQSNLFCNQTSWLALTYKISAGKARTKMIDRSLATVPPQKLQPICYSRLY